VDFDLSSEHSLIRQTVRELAEGRVAPVAAELDREHRFPYELVAELAELGLMGIPVPDEWGGGGADTLSYAIAVEELARVDSSVAVTLAAHTSLGTMPARRSRRSAGSPTSPRAGGSRPSASPSRMRGPTRAPRAPGPSCATGSGS
jgi:alkylation response protein AidB-like acyl-CoA dehydrogenase